MKKLEKVLIVAGYSASEQVKKHRIELMRTMGNYSSIYHLEQFGKEFTYPVESTPGVFTLLCKSADFVELDPNHVDKIYFLYVAGSVQASALLRHRIEKIPHSTHTHATHLVLADQVVDADTATYTDINLLRDVIETVNKVHFDQQNNNQQKESIMNHTRFVFLLLDQSAQDAFKNDQLDIFRLNTEYTAYTMIGFSINTVPPENDRGAFKLINSLRLDANPTDLVDHRYFICMDTTRNESALVINTLIDKIRETGNSYTHINTCNRDMRQLWEFIKKPTNNQQQKGITMDKAKLVQLLIQAHQIIKDGPEKSMFNPIGIAQELSFIQENPNTCEFMQVKEIRDAVNKVMTAFNTENHINETDRLSLNEDLQIALKILRSSHPSASAKPGIKTVNLILSNINASAALHDSRFHIAGLTDEMIARGGRVFAFRQKHQTAEANFEEAKELIEHLKDPNRHPQSQYIIVTSPVIRQELPGDVHNKLKEAFDVLRDQVSEENLNFFDFGDHALSASISDSIYIALYQALSPQFQNPIVPPNTINQHALHDIHTKMHHVLQLMQNITSALTTIGMPWNQPTSAPLLNPGMNPQPYGPSAHPLGKPVGFGSSGEAMLFGGSTNQWKFQPQGHPPMGFGSEMHSFAPRRGSQPTSVDYGTVIRPQMTVEALSVELRQFDGVVVFHSIGPLNSRAVEDAWVNFISQIMTSADFRHYNYNSMDENLFDKVKDAVVNEVNPKQIHLVVSDARTGTGLQIANWIHQLNSGASGVGLLTAQDLQVVWSVLGNLYNLTLSQAIRRWPKF